MRPSATLSIRLRLKEGKISIEQCNNFLEMFRASIPTRGSDWNVSYYSLTSSLVELKKVTECAGGKVDLNLNETAVRELIETASKIAENRAIILQKLKEAIAKNNVEEIKTYASKLCGMDEQEVPK